MRFTLGKKLAAGFGSILLVQAILAGIGYESAVTTAKVSHDVQFNSAKKDLTLAIQLAVEKEKVGGRDALLHGDMSNLNAARAEFREKMEALRPQLSSETSRSLFASIEQASANYDHLADRAIELGRSGKTAASLDVFYGPEAQQARADLKKSTTDLVAWYEKLKTEADDRRTANDSETKVLMLSLTLVGVLIGVVAAGVVTRLITAAFARMLAMFKEIAAHNLAIADMPVTSRDEIGEASIALNQMKNNLHELILSIRTMAEQVAASSEELSATSQHITANSEETTAQAKVVSEAGGQVNTNLQTLASGAEEMNTTIGEIAKNATEAARVAGQAVESAEGANQTVSKLGDSSVEIGKVIEVITSIAQQTNLLALNATIEAARAGEAGKGFAVVANEVKELAKQTAKATEEIKQKIGVIRENTGGAVGAIGGIKSVIDKISQISTTIATAVEEQSATTQEMARNVSEAARGASTISDNIQGVAEAAQGTSTSVGEAQTATEHLARTANELHDLVSRFTVDAASAAEFPKRAPREAARQAAAGH